MSSANDKLERVRKPRVHIKYEVETEGGTQEKELPFVAGVIGDFSGDGNRSLKSLKERKFTTIDPDNFNEVMAHQSPELNLRVDNALDENESELAVNLKFNSLEDFEPAKIVDQIPALKELKEARDKLRDILSKSDRSDELEQILEKTLQDNDKLNALAKELGLSEQ